MKNVFKKIDGVKTGIFAAGVLFGTAGVKILSSQDAKKVYTNCTAAVLRAKKCVMKTATTIQENAGDILSLIHILTQYHTKWYIVLLQKQRARTLGLCVHIQAVLHHLMQFFRNM